MVGFYGLDVFMAETSATCGGLDSHLERTGPLRDAQQLAAAAYGSRHTFFVTNGLRRPTRWSPNHWWPQATLCCLTATATSPTTTG